jgi:hypothetical protein
VELAISVMVEQVLLELVAPLAREALEVLVGAVVEPRLLEELEALAVTVLY